MIGVGIDLVDVARIKTSLEAAQFLDLNFHQSEIELYSQRKQATFIAGRFAAKEALVKAMGTGFVEGMSLADIEIIRLPNGAPAIQLHDSVAEIAKKLGIKDWHVSISHTKDYATAIVIAL